jgi:ABC-type spermidine/putrescine transport system permease subunit II
LANVTRIIMFIGMLPIFAYSFISHWMVASQLSVDDNWREHLVFTPTSVTKTKEIYEIDKFIYGFLYNPIITITAIVSFLAILVLLMYWVVRLFQKKNAVTA